MLETQNIKPKSFASCLELWYSNNKRELPWRENIDPYSVWLSEIILQQTQVKQGWDYFLKIRSAFPTVQDLAKADVDDFYPYWAGLGYYSRARNLLRTAKIISTEHQNRFPNTKSELIKLPGIGDYTASAIASICFKSSDIAMDGNLNRVFSRVFMFAKDLKVAKNKNELKALAETFAPTTNLGDFNQALMDLGSGICTTHNPICIECPLSAFCSSRENNCQLSFPVKSKPIKKETLHLHYFISNDNHFFIIKRDGGIWNNLNEFPGFWTNDKDQLVYSNSELTQTDISRAKLLWKVKHLLSHKTMHISFFSLDLQFVTGFQKIERGDLSKIAFPKAIDRFLSLHITL